MASVNLGFCNLKQMEVLLSSRINLKCRHFWLGNVTHHFVFVKTLGAQCSKRGLTVSCDNFGTHLPLKYSCSVGYPCIHVGCLSAS